jgi:hypothetical protein
MRKDGWTGFIYTGENEKLFISASVLIVNYSTMCAPNEMQLYFCIELSFLGFTLNVFGF